MIFLQIYCLYAFCAIVIFVCRTVVWVWKNYFPILNMITATVRHLNFIYFSPTSEMTPFGLKLKVILG
jgi:hypothetical protein